MEKQKNIPQLRFPDFNGDWERKKLGEVSIINPTTDKLPDKFIYIDLESVTNGELTKEAVAFKNEAPSRAQRVLERDDILFQMVRPYQKNNLYFDKNGDYVASTGYAQIKTKQSSRFIYQYLHLQKFVDEVIERCTGTSYPAINSKDLAKINIRFPSLPEQQKIASFFTAIDQKITQLKRKKTLLEHYKKGVMQKIFSQEIRFKNNHGLEFPKWEKKKLSSLLIERNTQAPKSDEYPLMAFVANKGVAYKGERYNREFLVSDGDNKKYKQTEYGDFIYSSNNLETGSIGLNSFGSASISPVYSIFQTRETCNSQFLKSFLVRKSFINKMIKYRQGVVYGQWRIHESDFLKIEESVPSIEEQIKIANFLSAIDNKINHSQTQIQKAELWKKGLLQKMFV
jgi:type I restriction enzyme, S subunit